jgi:hypothetical protein
MSFRVYDVYKTQQAVIICHILIVAKTLFFALITFFVLGVYPWLLAGRGLMRCFWHRHCTYEALICEWYLGGGVFRRREASVQDIIKGNNDEILP